MLLGTDLDQDIKLDLIKFLKDIKSTFARKHEAMPGISKDIITHKLNIDQNFKPMHQKRKRIAPIRNLIIQEEVKRLHKVKMIKEVKFPRCLANVVVIEKKNGNGEFV